MQPFIIFYPLFPLHSVPRIGFPSADKGTINPSPHSPIRLQYCPPPLQRLGFMAANFRADKLGKVAKDRHRCPPLPGTSRPKLPHSICSRDA